MLCPHYLVGEGPPSVKGLPEATFSRRNLKETLHPFQPSPSAEFPHCRLPNDP